MSEAPSFMTPGDEKDTAIPRFYVKPVQNKFKSDQAGRPIFDDVEFVEILIPGDKNTIVDEPARQHHRDRWPQWYDAFKKGQEAPSEGTPLEEWGGVTRSLVEELRFFHIRTVEQVAALDDAKLQRAIPMGGHALREKARRYLAQAEGSAPVDALAAENEVLRGNMEVMQTAMDELKAEVERLKAQRAE